MRKEVIHRYSLHRRLYHWVLSLAYSKHSTRALFLLSFAESSFFPIAPDVLQIPLTLERPDRAWFYASINTIGSVLGGIFGYCIGLVAWTLLAPYFFQYVFSEASFQHVHHLYQEWSFWAIFVAAFTPIPYKIFTIAAGVFQIPFLLFVLASMIGRSLRFFLVAALLNWKGKAIKVFIEKYFNLLTIAFVVLLALGFGVLELWVK